MVLTQNGTTHAIQNGFCGSDHAQRRARHSPAPPNAFISHRWRQSFGVSEHEKTTEGRSGCRKIARANFAMRFNGIKDRV
jgi:hypothetical protein